MKTFLKAWGLGLLLCIWLLIPAAVLLILHFVLDGFSLCFIAIPLGLWLIFAFFRAMILYIGNKNGSAGDPVRPNVNPYSKKTEDYKDKK